MGMFDFVKNAGENLLKRVGLDSEPDSGDVVAKIKEHKLHVEGLSVAVQDDVATVAGTVQTLETKEKVVLVVGNVKGIARVNDMLELPAPPPAPEPDVIAEAAPVEVPAAAPQATVFYTVKSGDTLGKIAKAHYGNAMKYPVIFEANKPMLTDPDRIYPGQVLRIPPLNLA